MKFVSVGNICLDRVLRYAKDIPRWGTEIFFEESEDRIGGQGANFAMAASRLGRETVIMGSIGNDVTGKSIFSSLRTLPHINSKFLRRENSTTGYTISVIRTDGERSFLTYLGHQTKFLLRKDKARVLECVSKNDIVHISGLFMMPRATSEMIDFAKEIKEEREGIVSFDPGWDPSGFDKRTRTKVFKILEYADYFEPNEIELLSLTRQKSIRQAILEITRTFDRVLALKLGNKGSLIVRGAERIRVPAFKTDVRDSTGAGDAFDAGFLSTVSHAASLEESGKFGNAVAALTISKSGNPYHRFPTLSETRRILESRDRN